MSRPYFSVGEEIILCRKKRPEFNGERVVLEIICTSEEAIKFCKRYRPEVNWTLGRCSFPAYALSDIPKGGQRIPPVFEQPCLRKKHKPADFSLEELLSIEEGIPA